MTTRKPSRFRRHNFQPVREIKSCNHVHPCTTGPCAGSFANARRTYNLCAFQKIESNAPQRRKEAKKNVSHAKLRNGFRAGSVIKTLARVAAHGEHTDDEKQAITETIDAVGKHRLQNIVLNNIPKRQCNTLKVTE